MLKGILAVAALLACTALTPAQEAKPTPPPSDREAQRQAERERKEAERRRKEEEKESQRQPGVRCARYHRKGS